MKSLFSIGRIWNWRNGTPLKFLRTILAGMLGIVLFLNVCLTGVWAEESGSGSVGSGTMLESEWTAYTGSMSSEPVLEDAFSGTLATASGNTLQIESQTGTWNFLMESQMQLQSQSSDSLNLSAMSFESQGPELVAEYLLSGNANDTSGNELNGVANNVTWTSVNPFSAKLNGTDASLRFPTSIQNGWIGWFSAWVRFDSTIPSGEYYILNDWSSNNGIVGIIGYDYNGGNPQVKFMRAKSGVSTDVSTHQITMDPTKFYHLTWVYDGASVYGYVNGVKTNPVTSFGVGWSIPNGLHVGEYTNGILHSPITVNRIVGGRYVPSDNEIEWMHSAGPSGISRYGLVAEYLLDGSADDTSLLNNDGIDYWASATHNHAWEANKASYFNGTNSRIAVAHASNNFFDANDAFSTSVWFKALDDRQAFLFLKNAGYWIKWNGAGQPMALYDGNYHDSLKSDWNMNQWYHLTMVDDGVSELKLYVNGVLDSSTPRNPNRFGEYPLEIGAYYPSQMFYGDLDNFRIYNRGLSAWEVQSLYNEMPSCNDGIMNQNETAVDQGGVCWNIPRTSLKWEYLLNGSATDTSWRGNSWTANNVTWTQTNFNNQSQSASFNWSNSYIDLWTSFNSVFNQSSWSISLWSNLTLGSWTYWSKYIANDSNTSQRQFWISLTPTGKIYIEMYSSPNVQVFSTQSVPSGWYNLSVVYGESTIKVYVNNVEYINTAMNLLPSTANSTNVGRREYPWYEWYFGGNMQSIRIYNRTLSTSEIQSLYQESTSAPTNPTASTPYVPFWCSSYMECGYVTNATWYVNPTASNSPGANIENNSATLLKNTGDPITLSTGESIYENTFLRTSGTPLPYEFKLTNRTRATYDGPVGFGWDHNHNIFLREEQSGNVLLYDGRLGVHSFPKNADGTYGKNTSLNATLTKNGGTLYQVTFSTGLKYDFGTNLRILQQVDRYGNDLSYTYDGEKLTTVTDSLDRAYAYAYLANGRLDTVTDGSSREVKLQYYTTGDTLGGENDLKSVMISSGNPVQTKTISYTYSKVAGNETLSHNLKTLVDARGQTYVDNTFDANDRVISQVFGNGTLNYVYEMDAGNTYVAKTTVTNRLGTVTDYQYNQNGNILSTTIRGATEADNIVSTFVYDTTGRLIRETKPRGNGVTYEYDSIGNVTKKREKASMVATDDDQQDLITLSTYGGDFNQLLGRTTPGGTQSALTYDATGNLIKTEVQNVHLDDTEITHTLSTHYEYDAQGRVTKTTDPTGSITRITYGTGGFATAITKGLRATEVAGIYDETNSSTTSYTYDTHGNPLTTTDGEGKVSTFTYDAFDRLTSSLSPTGIVQNHFYDANNSRMRTETPLNATTKRSETKAHDVLDQVTSNMIMGEPMEWQMNMTTYNGNQNVTATTDAMGLRTTYSYDALEHIREKRVIMDPLLPANDLVTTYVYDKNGNLIRTTDPTGAVTNFTYDAFDRLVASTDAANTTIHVSYDRDGHAIETTTTVPGVGEGAESVLLSKMAITYNEIGKVLSESVWGIGENPTALVTKYAYDQNGNVLVTTNPMGKSITNTYDSLGRIKKVRDELGNETRFAYDRRGLVTIRKTVGADGKEVATTYLYDDDGRKVRETDANGDFVSYSYDKLNRIIQKTDEAGDIIDYAYDIFWNVLSETSHLSPTETVTIRYEYNKRNQLVKLTDSNGNITRYEYDVLGRKTREIHADDSFSTFAYNGVRFTGSTDANGTVITNSYDAIGRLVGRSIATGSGVLGTSAETYSYDALGRMVGAANSQSGSEYTLGFTYNAFGNLVSETQNGKSVSYSYDKNGNRRSIETDGFGEVGTGSAAYHADYAYDILDRLAGVTYNGGNIANYAYTGVTLNGISFWNGTSMSYAHDALNRLAGIGYGIAGLEDRSFTYSPEWNIVSDGIKDYVYDPIGRLTDIASLSGSTLAIEARGLEYDAMGNRLVESASSGNIAYVGNELNQYETVTGSGTATSYAYDANGNVVDNGKLRFGYDYRNRVVEVRNSTDGTLVAEYGYDALGRRASKSVGATATEYLYAGEDAIAEQRTVGGIASSTYRVFGNGSDDLLAYETSESALAGSDAEEYAFCLARVVPYAVDFSKYGHGGILERCEELATEALVTTRKTYFVQRDQLGSTVALTDGSGSVVQRYSYDAFGKAYVGAGETGSGAVAEWVPVSEFAGSLHGNDRLYTGREYDAETGLHYYRARHYDAGTGRFLQRDPVGIADQANLYAYVGNGPVGRTDPSGMVASQFLANTVDVVGEALEYAIPDRRTIQNGIWKSLFVGWSAVAVYTGWACAGAATATIGCAGVAVTTLGTTAPLCGPLAVATGVACTPTAAGLAMAGVGGYMMSTSGGGNNFQDEAIEQATTNSSSKKLAEESWMTETKEFWRPHWESVFKKWKKYYSADNTWHNWWTWKVFEKVGWKLKRIGTADENLNIFKK